LSINPHTIAISVAIVPRIKSDKCNFADWDGELRQPTLFSIFRCAGGGDGFALTRGLTGKRLSFAVQ